MSVCVHPLYMLQSILDHIFGLVYSLLLSTLCKICSQFLFIFIACFFSLFLSKLCISCRHFWFKFSAWFSRLSVHFLYNLQSILDHNIRFDFSLFLSIPFTICSQFTCTLQRLLRQAVCVHLLYMFQPFSIYIIFLIWQPVCVYYLYMLQLRLNYNLVLVWYIFYVHNLYTLQSLRFKLQCLSCQSVYVHPLYILQTLELYIVVLVW